jgi:4-hydroxy-tetrahydrodipicolinate reductase
MGRGNMMEKVILVGLGSTGRIIARLVIEKGMKIVGAFDIDEKVVGKDIGEVIGIERKVGVSISRHLANISEMSADVVLYITVSKLKDLYPQILPAIKAGINIISTADELSFPWIHPEAKDIDEVAKKFNVTVFGTGANPGFVTDVLPAALTGGCQEVSEIKVRRVVDFAPYGGGILKQWGIGLSVEEWEEARKKGEVKGHIASPGLVRYIADCMDLRLDEVREKMESVIAKVPRLGLYSKVEKGKVAGILQSAYGIKKGKEVITFEYNATIQPAAEKIEPGTFWSIKGKPSIEVSLKGTEAGEESVLVTSARVVNSIPIVIKSRPGLLTQKDLPLGACIMRK